MSIYGSLFLPPANEVWGKVIFLHQFVILFTGGWHAWLLGGAGHVWLLGGACMVARGGMRGCSRGACMVTLGGACMVTPGGGMHGCSGGACVVSSVFSDTMRYGQ